MPNFSNTRLSDTFIKNLKPREERYEVYDANQPGFAVRVSKTGVKSWIVFGRINGQRVRRTLGAYPAMSLAKARERARETLQEIRDGISQKPAAPLRFKEALELWYEREQASHKSFRNVQNAITLHVEPALRGKLLNQVTKHDLLSIIDGLEDAGKRTQANRVRAYLKRFFKWAAERDLIDLSPAEHLPRAATEASRDRVINQDELRAVWQAAEQLGYPFGPMTQLLILTGQRRAEVAGALWSEIDLKNRTWTIGKERSKNGKANIVGLSEQAMRLIKQLPRRLGSDYLFTVTGSTASSGFSHAKTRLDRDSGVSDWRLHDLRRTFATHSVEHLFVAPMIVDKILNHQSGVVSGVMAVYQRQELLSERRNALQAWADYLDQLLAKQSGAA
ncbi:tyrosine-type recombinase/integrase [Roseobacter sp. HKCC-CH-9208]|uniref:tyrosine-type recombinase/integrase n=1 Tax=Roseobacter sp. HKCC-CH-9208 TaxID=3120339 RepID=UPI0030EB31D1